MSPVRFALGLLGLAAPLLAGLLWLPPGSGVSVMLWAATVGAVGAWAWFRLALPLNRILREAHARDALEARWRLRSLQDELTAAREVTTHQAELVSDLSSGLGEGLIVVDDDMRLRLINEEARRFCGHDSARSGSLLLEVLREPKVLKLIRKASRGKRPRPIITENPRGQWEVRAFPIRRGGAVILASEVGIVHRAEELRRRFVQDLSHELRSPLSVLRTTVETIAEEVDVRAEELLVRQIERITLLTDELQELASLEAGDIQLHAEAVSLQALVDEVLEDLQPEARAAQVALTSELPAELSIQTDRRALSRVVSNLVLNAVKYNRPDGRVQVSAAAIGDDTIELAVEDTGIGIPSSELQAVFQRFYRIDTARTPGVGGLGLGLAIVKHLVHHLGGSISASSREGVGTTMTVALPAVLPVDGDDES